MFLSINTAFFRAMSTRRSRICFVLTTSQILLTIFLVRYVTNNSRKTLAEAPKCCQKQTKVCLACQDGISVEEFCLIYSGMYDCPPCCKETIGCLACQNDVTLEDICKGNSGKYGCEISIMVAVEVFPQKGYAEFTASVLRDYLNVDSEDVYIFASNPKDYYENVQQTWRTWYGESVNILAPRGMGTVNSSLLESFLDSKYNTLLLLKSDMILLKSWRSFIEYNLPRTDGILSLYRRAGDYNMGYVEAHWLNYVCKDIHDGLCEGDSFGTYGIAITQKVAKIFLAHGGRYLSEKGLKMVSKENGFKLLHSPRSLVIHIGQAKQTKENCGTNEVPHRFNRCELPDWIQGGIEFYFDRCTNPNEKFSYDEFRSEPNISERFWARPALSFSLYGTSPRYTQLALLNANRMASIYPGWKMWIYHDNSVPKKVLSEICEFNVRFIDMTGSSIKNRMSWRFLVASEPVAIYAIRDIDSWILTRGKAAVDEWLASGRKFHVMRDHFLHSGHAINGGIWGGRHDAVPNMKELLLERGIKGGYMNDMNFLRDIIWPIAKSSCWVHDSHPSGKWGEVHPFPTELDNPRFFVGSVN